MLEQTGLVLRVADGIALVRLERPHACGACGSAARCGTATLGSLVPSRSLVLAVADRLGTKPGEWVVLGLDPSTLVGAAALAYLPPLAGLVLGAVGAEQLGWADGATLLAGLLGLGAGIVAGRLCGSVRSRPRLLRRLAAPGGSSVGVPIRLSPDLSRGVSP
jgi:sigma-E factor negative regulatory protein RseC